MDVVDGLDELGNVEPEEAPTCLSTTYYFLCEMGMQRLSFSYYDMTQVSKNNQTLESNTKSGITAGAQSILP